jgi:tRNA A37 methylthiotransferase MiaB
VAADNADDIPTEENIERMEELVEAAQSEAKTHLQLLVSKTVSTIVSHIQMSEMKGIKINSQWLRWMLHRLQHLLYEVSFSVIPNSGMVLYAVSNAVADLFH